MIFAYLELRILQAMYHALGWDGLFWTGLVIAIVVTIRKK